ncbi:Uncharacterized protein APZ42_015386 [Daphnia magna]|uniref:Uncharacterized protein n=1 Tax=Daphnia magna TaxID=35525 RepID=A0A0P5ZGI9_9CRUS|nr:Uncharacterized protein APZ42_015386 [Daphnia magna]
MDQRLKDLLSNLGRRTLRGVKPCPKCGTYNGTRGFSCKNKSCDVVFKAADDRKKKTTEACRISTENQNAQVFSVRLRDKGPDYRDFVQLTAELVDAGDGSFSTVQNAECFVESCSNKNDSFNLLPITACQHIQATLNCHSESEILPIKASLIHSLNIPSDLKDELWNMATEDNQGLQMPIVQRVSKTIFVVKCAVSNKFSLGFLHCSVIETRSKTGTLERKFVCPCRKLKAPNSSEISNKECVHFYACILAFISDEKFMNEFSYHIQASNVLSVSLDSIEEMTERQLVVHFEVMPQVSDEADLLGDVRVLDSLVLAADDGSSGFADDVSATGNVNLTLPVGINMSELLNGTLEVVPQMTCHTAPIISAEEAAQIQRGKIKIAPLKRPRKLVSETSNHQHQNQLTTETIPKRTPSLEEVTSSLLFEQWLASVTEHINQTMHFAMPGNPDPLVYQIPHSFFDCLRERISSNGRKKRLPNSTVVFQRKDRPPFATLTKYTWHLNNAMHVKHVFDTALVQLELTRSFVENQDGTFDLYVPKNIDTSGSGADCSGLPTLRPLELQTYLIIGHGNTNTDGDCSCPFTIEWIPDVLLQSKFGELSLQFQFGHQRHPLGLISERSGNKRLINGIASTTTLSNSIVSRRKKLKVVAITDTDAKELQNLNNIELDFDGVAPLNDSEFQELTKSVP